MDLEKARWRKSSYSDGHGDDDCVEVAFVPGTVTIRDTKNRTGGTLQIPESAWRTFTTLHA